MTLCRPCSQCATAADSIQSTVAHQAEVLQQLEAQLRDARQQQVGCVRNMAC